MAKRGEWITANLVRGYGAGIDETAYLLSTPANAARLTDAMTQLDRPFVVAFGESGDARQVEWQDDQGPTAWSPADPDTQD